MSTGFTITPAACMMCGKGSDPISVTEDQFNRWNLGHETIQVVFPEMSADDRELILTGIHSDCWDRLMPNDDDDDDDEDDEDDGDI